MSTTTTNPKQVSMRLTTSKILRKLVAETSQQAVELNLGSKPNKFTLAYELQRVYDAQDGYLVHMDTDLLPPALTAASDDAIRVQHEATIDRIMKEFSQVSDEKEELLEANKALEEELEEFQEVIEKMEEDYEGKLRAKAFELDAALDAHAKTHELVAELKAANEATDKIAIKAWDACNGWEKNALRMQKRATELREDLGKANYDMKLRIRELAVAKTTQSDLEEEIKELKESLSACREYNSELLAVINRVSQDNLKAAVEKAERGASFVEMSTLDTSICATSVAPSPIEKRDQSGFNLFEMPPVEPRVEEDCIQFSYPLTESAVAAFEASQHLSDEEDIDDDESTFVFASAAKEPLRPSSPISEAESKEEDSPAGFYFPQLRQARKRSLAEAFEQPTKAFIEEMEQEDVKPRLTRADCLFEDEPLETDFQPKRAKKIRKDTPAPFAGMAPFVFRKPDAQSPTADDTYQVQDEVAKFGQFAQDSDDCVSLDCSPPAVQFDTEYRNLEDRYGGFAQEMEPLDMDSEEEDSEQEECEYEDDVLNTTACTDISDCMVSPIFAKPATRARSDSPQGSIMERRMNLSEQFDEVDAHKWKLSLRMASRQTVKAAKKFGSFIGL